jgi:hypothetical protein
MLYWIAVLICDNICGPRWSFAPQSSLPQAAAAAAVAAVPKDTFTFVSCIVNIRMKSVLAAVFSILRGSPLGDLDPTPA